MFSKKIQCLFILLNANFLSLIDGNQNFFKVPLEIREKNRPERLVDNVNDPEMIKLKSLQDEFFLIVGNSSLGKEFKSFNQIFQLIDSDAGLELGRIFLNSVMIGIGNKHSTQLLSEFLDDFQYRVSPDLADALNDYKDFIKTIDLKMIPLTFEMLFKKDSLGNSLAQMPMGQLVDLIQPEAAKYGIDVRNLINGIVGRDDSTFPELVRKMIHNFNYTSMFNSFINSVSEDPHEKSAKHKNSVAFNKKQRKDNNLTILRPFVAKILKENEIDLEADAVIQVLTPFVNSWLQSLQGLIPVLQNNRDFNSIYNHGLLPLINMFSFQMNKSSKTFQDSNKNILEAAMMLIQNIDKNKNMNAILNLVTNLVSKQRKTGKEKMTMNTNEDDMNLDLNSFMQMAMSVMGDSKNEGVNMLFELLSNQMVEKPNVNTQKMMEMASNLIGGLAKTKNDISNQHNKKLLDENKKEKTFSEALENFLLRIQSDKKCHIKIKDAFGFAQQVLALKADSLGQIQKKLKEVLQPFAPDIEKDIDSLFVPFYYSKEEWNSFWRGVMEANFKEKLLENTLDSVTDIIMLLSSDEFQKKQNTFLRSKSHEIFSSIGLQGVTINNFPERLKPYISMVSKGWELPVRIESLLKPLRSSLKEIWTWYTKNARELSRLKRMKVSSHILLFWIFVK